MIEERPITNCHVHIFTGEHVPRHLARTNVPWPLHYLIGSGWAYNSIRGDVGLAANDPFSERLLGTPRKAFSKLEIFAQFRIKNIKAEFSYTWLDPGGDVPGISRGRMITTVSFVGGFPVKLN